jgi:hypothetical protein
VGLVVVSILKNNEEKLIEKEYDMSTEKTFEFEKIVKNIENKYKEIQHNFEIENQCKENENKELKIKSDKYLENYNQLSEEQIQKDLKMYTLNATLKVKLDDLNKTSNNNQKILEDRNMDLEQKHLNTIKELDSIKLNMKKWLDDEILQKDNNHEIKIQD